MAEQEPNSTEPQGFAIAVPTEVIVDGAGEERVVYNVGAPTEADAMAGAKLMADLYDGEIVASRPSSRSSNQAFFSSKKWNSPWEPTGPRPNWKTTSPEDPSLN